MQPSLSKNHEAAVVKRATKRHDEGEHGGSWKVAFADFCLALMCLYLVLWVLAQRNQEELREQLKDKGIALIDNGRGRMSETLGGPRGSLISREPLPRSGQGAVVLRASDADGATEHERRLASREIPVRDKVRYESPSELFELAQVLAKLSEGAGLKANLQTMVTPYGLRVMLHDTDRQGMFEIGSAVPTERFRRLLRQMGPLFARMENQMLIIGHTDSLPYANPSNHSLSNWTLSSSRATAARGQLIDGGMSAGSVLQVVGMAEQAPLDPARPAASQNRRIELLILTTAQARSIAAMFGAPGEGTDDLLPGVEAELPGPGVFAALRERLKAQGQRLQGGAAAPSSAQ